MSVELLKQNVIATKRGSCYKGLFITLGISMTVLFLVWNSQLRTLANKHFTSRETIESRETHESLAERLEREVRVLCWVMTTPANHKTKARHVQQTWGKRCNRLLFVTSEEDDELETLVTTVKEDYKYLWGKTREAFLRIYQDYMDEADWFLKADDDTYVLVENLRYMLYGYTTETPIYFGCNYKIHQRRNESYMSGGSGYVLSKAALRRFIEVSLKDGKKCRIKDNEGAEDAEMGKCLQAAGVLAGDSRDAQHKIRFFAGEPYAALIPHYFDGDFWLYWLNSYRMRNCQECLSNYMISFHYVKPVGMHVYDFFNYDFYAYGLETEEESLPKRLSFDELIIAPGDNSRERT